MIPFRTRCYPLMHPAHLAAVVQLSGMSAPSLEGARILEIQCGPGHNLLPLASSCPKAEFLGVDHRPEAIKAAREFKSACALKNVSFETHPVSSLGAALGSFDYVLAHQVLSFIGPEERRSFLSAVAQLLKPEGLACLSFYVAPGAYATQTLREALRFQLAGVADPAQQGTAASQVLSLLDRACANSPGAFPKIISAELAAVRRADAAQFFEEYLAPQFFPHSVTEFFSECQRSSLSYVTDASLGTLVLDGLPGEAQKQLVEMAGGKRARLEQYADFISGRTQRTAIVGGKAIGAGKPIAFAGVKHLFISSPFTTRRKITSAPGQAEGAEFVSVNGNVSVRISDPLAISLIDELKGVWPRMCSIAELAERLWRRPEWSKESDHEARFLAALVGAIAKGIILIRSADIIPASSASGVKPAPVAAVLARSRAELPNYFHQTVSVSEDKRWVMEWLGTAAGDGAEPSLLARLEQDYAARPTKAGIAAAPIKEVLASLRQYALVN